MAVWQLQDAKARFSELVETTVKKGPQIVSRRGVETVVVVPIEEWKQLKQRARPGLLEVLLGPGPRFENIVPERGKLRLRKPIEFE